MAVRRQSRALEQPEAPSTMWRYDYAENDQNTYEWIESRQSGDLNNMLPVPLPVKARILLLEGLTEQAIAACCSQLRVPRAFFTHHQSESVRARSVNITGSKHCLSAKWSRLVDQSLRHWEINLKILKGTPYSVDTSTDPRRFRLEHERYQRVPGVFRSYCPISRTSKGLLQHAARENISLFWTNDNPSLFVLVVVDPKREHYIVEKKYDIWGFEYDGSSTTDSCFLDEVDGYTKARFVEEVRTCEEQTLMGDFVHGIQNIIAHIMVTDTTEVLTSLHNALDEIDLSLSRDDTLRRSLHVWRERFGLWRQDILHSLVSIKEMSQTFDQHKSCPTCARQPSPSSTSKHEVELAGLRADLEDALTRLNSTFQAVMSTMSIIQSQKAILEAESVSKLTALAFFFIPLSFVASLFGMNLVEFDHKLKLWIWITVSASVTIVAYGFLFLGTISTTLRKKPQFLHSLKAAMRRSRIVAVLVFPWMGPLVVFVPGVAGLGVGLWKLYTSKLSTGAKIGISFAVFAAWVPSLYVVLPIVLPFFAFVGTKAGLRRARLRREAARKPIEQPEQYRLEPISA